MEKVDKEWITKNVYKVGKTSDEVKRLYDEWSNRGYDDFAAPKDQPNGRTLMAKAISELFTDTNKLDLKLFDVAAGTGLVGLELQKQGFVHIDALEPSPGMWKVAEERGIYEQLINDFMSDKRLDIDKDTYDVLTVYAAIGDGHIPWSALYEMVRIVKPGGIIALGVNKQDVFATTKTFGDELVSLMQKLEDENKWQQIRKEIYSNHFLEYDGVLYLFRVK